MPPKTPQRDQSAPNLFLPLTVDQLSLLRVEQLRACLRITGLRTTYKLKTELCTRLLDFVEHNHGTPQAEEAAALAQQFWSTCQQKEADAAAHRRLRAQQQKQQKQHHQLNQQVKQQLQQQQQQQLLLLQEAQQQPAARASNTPRAASVNLGASGGRVTKRQQHKERASKAGLAGGGAASGAAGGWAPAGGASGDSSGSHGAVESLVQLQRGAQHTASGAAAAAAHTPADAAAGGGGSAGASLAHPMASPVLVMPPTLQQPLGQLLTGPSGTPMLLMCPPQTYQLQPPSQQQQQQMEYMLQTMATPQELAAANAGALAHTAALSAAGAPAAAAGGQAPPLSSAQPASAAAAAGVRASALAASATPLAPTTPQAPPASAASPAPATAPPDAAGAGPGSVAALMQAPAVLAAHSLHAAALSLNASHEATPAGLKFRCCCGGGSSRIGPASAADSSGAGPEPVQVFCVVCGVLQHAACCGIGAPAAAAAPDGAAAALAAEEPPSPLGGHMCDVCCMVLAAADSGWQLQDPLLLSPRALTMRASPQQPLQQGFAGTFFNDGPLQGTLAAQQQHAQQTQQTQRHVPQAQLRTEVLLGCMRIAHAAAAAPHTPALSAMSPPSRIRTVISTGTSRSGGAESSNALAGGAGWPYAFEWPAACSVKLNGALIDASAAVAAQPAAMPGAQPSPAVPAPTRGLISLTPSALAGSNTLEVICTDAGRFVVFAVAGSRCLHRSQLPLGGRLTTTLAASGWPAAGQGCGRAAHSTTPFRAPQQQQTGAGNRQPQAGHGQQQHQQRPVGGAFGASGAAPATHGTFRGVAAGSAAAPARGPAGAAAAPAGAYTPAPAAAGGAAGFAGVSSEGGRGGDCSSTGGYKVALPLSRSAYQALAGALGAGAAAGVDSKSAVAAAFPAGGGLGGTGSGGSAAAAAAAGTSAARAGSARATQGVVMGPSGSFAELVRRMPPLQPPVDGSGIGMMGQGGAGSGSGSVLTQVQEQQQHGQQQQPRGAAADEHAAPAADEADAVLRDLSRQLSDSLFLLAGPGRGGAAGAATGAGAGAAAGGAPGAAGGGGCVFDDDGDDDLPSWLGVLHSDSGCMWSPRSVLAATPASRSLVGSFTPCARRAPGYGGASSSLPVGPLLSPSPMQGLARAGSGWGSMGLPSPTRGAGGLPASPLWQTPLWQSPSLRGTAREASAVLPALLPSDVVGGAASVSAQAGSAAGAGVGAAAGATAQPPGAQHAAPQAADSAQPEYLPLMLLPGTGSRSARAGGAACAGASCAAPQEPDGATAMSTDGPISVAPHHTAEPWWGGPSGVALLPQQQQQPPSDVQAAAAPAGAAAHEQARAGGGSAGERGAAAGTRGGLASTAPGRSSAAAPPTAPAPAGAMRRVSPVPAVKRSSASKRVEWADTARAAAAEHAQAPAAGGSQAGNPARYGRGYVQDL